MDSLTRARNWTFPMEDVITQQSDLVLHGNCPVMRVTYRTRMAPIQNEQVHGDIKIVIPGDQAALHVTHVGADGRRRMTFVTGHHISVIPARQPHAIRCERQSDVIVILLDQTFFEQKARAACASVPSLIERYTTADAFLRETGRMLRGEFQMHRIPSATFLESLAAVIAIHLAMNYGDHRRGAPDLVGLPPYKLRRVQSFIEQYLADVIAVKQLATLIDMSPYHFSRMFKRTTGYPPYLYITMQRVDHARELLRSTSLALQDVGATVGFQTQSQFTNVFHKLTGVTPRVFRLNCKGRDVDCAPRPVVSQDGVS